MHAEEAAWKEAANKCFALGTEIVKVKFTISYETAVDDELCTDSYDVESNWASGGGSA